jgi:5-methylcytosine-specific restriction protein A
MHGHVLRVFTSSEGTVGNPESPHIYLGAFELDPQLPFVSQDMSYADSQQSVTVFRLRPTENAYIREDDRSLSGDVRMLTEANLVDIEENFVAAFSIRATPETTGNRKESNLADRFKNQHPSGATAFKRWRLRPAGELNYLHTDLYDTTTNTLYEAKAHATRDSVRLAIGQLLDYRRHISPEPQMCLLVPEKPNDDLLALLKSVGIDCVYECHDGHFLALRARD